MTDALRWQLHYLLRSPITEDSKTMKSVLEAPKNPTDLVILDGKTEQPIVRIECDWMQGWKPIFYRIRATSLATNSHGDGSSISNIATVFGRARENDGKVEGQLWTIRADTREVVDMPPQLYREGAIRNLMGG